MGGSSSKSSSKPVDMTPGAFANLQQPFADALNKLIQGAGTGTPSGLDAITQGYTGPTTTPTTANENTILQQLMNTTSGAGNPPAAGGGTPPAGSGTGPATDPATQQLLANTTQSGSSAANAAGFVDQLGIKSAPQPGLDQFMGNLAGASQTGAFGGTQNPFLQSYIQSAQRQTQQALEESLGRTLPGRFTQAGQSTQPGSSSAFDRAAAIATRGSADALGDIATKIGYGAYSDAANREASALEGELGRRGVQGLQDQQLTSAAQQSQLDRALQAPKIASDLKTAQSQVSTQEVNNLVTNLQAQALPRLVNDLGVERGMEAFNQRVNSLLSTLGIAAGTTRPVISNESKSSSGSVSLK